MLDYEFYYEQYRREARNSIANQKDLIDYQSTVSAALGSRWLRAAKQPATIRYIDGSALLNLHPTPPATKDWFPRGKYRRNPYVISENQNPDNTGRSSACAAKQRVARECEKTPSSLTTNSDGPAHPPKSARNRVSSAIILDDMNSAAKKYGRRATTNANGAWVRRQKSMTQCQLLTKLLRGDEQLNKVLLRKRACPQSSTFSTSSNSSAASLLHKRRRNQR